MNLKNTQIIEAVDGRLIDLGKMKAEGSLKWDDWKKRDLTQGEVGCYLSHVRIWNNIIAQNIEKTLICEDDIILRPDANEIADKFMNEVPDDWDIIHFHSHDKVGSGSQNDNLRKRIGDLVWKGCNEGGGSVCYAISQRAARFLVGYSSPICYAVDGIINKLTRPKRSKEYHGYVCNPFICEVSNTPSEIDLINKRKSN